jgi:DNA sulfur modification protein DndB
MTVATITQKETLTVPALKCHQQEYEFFAFILTAEQLAQISYVSSREGKDGYQRLLNPKRAEAIKRYIELGNTLPNNIILNFNNPDGVNFDKQTRILTIPYIPKSAWVIDGQHRLYGADLLKNLLFTNHLARTYEFLVSAFVGLNVTDQAKIFVDINSYQEGVNKSLLYDLMNFFETEDDNQEAFYISRASDIVNRLNSDPESPFYQKISLTKDRISKMISQASFVDAIIIHLDKGGIISHTNEYQLSLEEQYKILKNYFNSVRDTLPDLWFNEKSILTKTTGFNALIAVLPTVFEQTVQKYNSFELEFVKKVVSSLRGLPWLSKDFKGQQGRVASKQLSETIRKSIISNIDSLDLSTGKKRLAI